MTIDTSNLLNSIMESLERIDYIHPETLPDIDLYMDQITTFMDTHLDAAKRNREDKILTKTMINNYAKNDLIPPPVKKKYSKEHLLVLIFIYYFKGVLSINDIENLLNPITKRFFHSGEDFDLISVYNEVFGMEAAQVAVLKEDVLHKYKESEKTFENAPEEEKDFLQLFAFICTLSFDVYIKKLLIEKLIDELPKLKDGREMKWNK